MPSPLSLLGLLTVSLYLPAVSCASSCSHALAKADCASAPPNSNCHDVRERCSGPKAISGDNASVSIPIGGAASLASHSLLNHTTISQYVRASPYAHMPALQTTSVTSPTSLSCPGPFPYPQLVQPPVIRSFTCSRQGRRSLSIDFHRPRPYPSADRTPSARSHHAGQAVRAKRERVRGAEPSGWAPPDPSQFPLLFLTKLSEIFI